MLNGYRNITEMQALITEIREQISVAELHPSQRQAWDGSRKQPSIAACFYYVINFSIFLNLRQTQKHTLHNPQITAARQITARLLDILQAPRVLFTNLVHLRALRDE